MGDAAVPTPCLGEQVQADEIVLNTGPSGGRRGEPCEEGGRGCRAAATRSWRGQEGTPEGCVALQTLTSDFWGPDRSVV